MTQKHEGSAMRNDYLWNGSGEPDPEIQRLETTLRRFRHDQPAPVLPALEPSAAPTNWWQRFTASLAPPRWAAATLVILAVASGLALSLTSPSPNVANEHWRVELTAAPLQSENATPEAKKEWLAVGQTLETGPASKASISVGEIGRLEVEPSTRLRLLQSAAGRKQIALDRGTIHATIWAPPGQFVVDTPSARAVDLGCMYTLHVYDNGAGILRTTLGWVGFHRNGRESFIPAGAACATHPDFGPGTPYFEDASDAFRSALARFDSATEPGVSGNASLAIVLREARPRDAFTLWHVLQRVAPSDRPTVYDRLTALVPPPPDVTRDGVLRLDRPMLDSWWNAFDLGDISLWRRFEQSWTGRGTSAP
jgi:FecR protein